MAAEAAAIVPIVSAMRREIAKFVAVTRRGAACDAYLGRRRTRRHHRSWPLLVTTLQPRGQCDVSVALHNASELGLAFHSAQPYSVGSYVAVKLFWHDPHAHRVPAVVRHCTAEAGGYLVGCQFDVEDEMWCRRACDVRSRWYEG
ncbi:MAG: PilZ domain-containing protein [Phycisphaerae bacterium]|nr:PilZ domain-containing protein [Phycisphaerae bacterium]